MDDDPAATAPPRPCSGSQGLTDDELEQRLCCLAAQIAVREAEFLGLVAELDRRGLWELWGIRSAAHWLSWRLGMRLGAARERVRVAHALELLPAIATAFAEGRLTYCKVRALTRVATPSTEAELLEIALGATGAQLERIVRAWNKVLTAEMSASSQLGRSLRRRTEHDGSVVYTLRLAADDAPIMDAAIDLARRVVLDDDGRPIETPEETKLAAEVTTDPPQLRADADAFLLLAESFVATGPVGARGDGLEVVVHADLRDLLPERPDSTPEQTEPAGAAGPTPPEPAPAPDGPAGVRSTQGQPLVAATALRRICETSVRVILSDLHGRPLDLGRRVRHATVKQRRVLHLRDNGCCRFPGCTQRRRLIPHHVDWWRDGGPTDLDNLVLVCPSHHRAVHEVGYQVRARGGGRFGFTRPDGRPVTAHPGLGLGPVEAVRDPGTDAATPWETPVPVWGGERLDLGFLIDGMVANTVNGSGVLLPDVPLTDLPRVIREATGWPLGGDGPGHAVGAGAGRAGVAA